MRNTAMLLLAGAAALALAACQAGAQSPQEDGSQGPPVPPGMQNIDERDRGDVLEQVDEAKAAFELEGTDAARYAYANLLMEAGSFEVARGVARPLLDAADPSLDALRLVARLSYFVGDYAQAERLFTDLVGRDPGNPRALTGLVLTYYQTNRFDKALELSQGQGAGFRTPILDLMAAFGEDAPYLAEWSGGPSTEIPFVSTDPLPVIEVEVGGRKIYAIIDTGADVFVLDSDIAAELGIEPVTSMMGMFAGGRQAEIAFGKVDALRLGGVTLHSVPISLLPTKRLLLGDVEIGGIVGTSVLRQFLSTLDYPRGRIVLRERSTASAASFMAEHKGAIEEELPFYLQGSHFILTHGSLNGYEGMLFHVDSGLAGLPAFAAPEETLEYVGIPLPELVVHEGTMGGGGGGFAVGEFEIESLGLGRLVRHDLIGSYGAQPPGSYWGLGFILDGLVSHNFLKAYAWTMDFDAMRMYFSRDAGTPLGE